MGDWGGLRGTDREIPRGVCVFSVAAAVAGLFVLVWLNSLVAVIIGALLIVAGLTGLVLGAKTKPPGGSRNQSPLA